ncbi:MAG: glycosyltransferase family 4 protein [Reyranella sp.]|nr:glycosyltransferase family 4 protein [Reyranella sp.]
MKALIIDPALRSMGGHHYNAALTLKAELSALGIDHACLGSSFAEAGVTKDLGCTPCFSRSVYGRAYRELREFRDGVRLTRVELGLALTQPPSRGLALHGDRSRPDLLILPCCDQVLALAVAQYLRRAWFDDALRGRRWRPPLILLWLLFGPHVKKATDDPSLQALYGECREAFAALRRAAGAERIQAFCETAGMADAYRTVTGLNIGVAPGPGLARDVDGVCHNAPSDTAPTTDSLTGAAPTVSAPTVVCLGFANAAKGYRLLPGAIARVLAGHRHVRFLVHGIFCGSDTEDQEPVFDRLAGIGPRVTVRTDVLSQSDYLSWLRQADLVLLPYDPEVYRTRGSGLFAEARRLGIPVVATRGCGFAEPAFRQGWGAEITDYDEAGIARAVLQALGGLDAMTARVPDDTDPDPGTILRAAVDAARAGALRPRERRFWRLFTSR